MGLFENLKNWWGGERRGRSFRDPALSAFFGANESESGVVVTEDTALQCSAVWAATRVISEGVAALPLILYKRDGDGRVKASDHPVYNLLRNRPNPYLSSFTFREVITAHALLWGQGYAEIERDLGGRAKALWLLRPDYVTCDQRPNGAPFYVYDHPNLGKQELEWDQVFYFGGLGFDGIQSYSMIRMARESIGLGMAAERFGAKLFGSGAKPSGILTTPGHLSDDAVARLRRDFTSMHSGLSNAHRVAILEGGLQWQSIGIPPDDAQFLQTRSFQISEIARWFNIPTSKLRDSGGKTYATLEQENLAFLTETLNPWLIRFEQEVWAKLLQPHERSEYYAEHLVDSVLRADIDQRYKAYAIGRNWGFLSVNDVRAKENMPPVPNGDVYLQPLNMQPLQAPSGPSAPTATPAVGVAPTGDPPVSVPPPDSAAGAPDGATP